MRINFTSKETEAINNRSCTNCGYKKLKNSGSPCDKCLHGYMYKVHPDQSEIGPSYWKPTKQKKSKTIKTIETKDGYVLKLTNKHIKIISPDGTKQKYKWSDYNSWGSGWFIASTTITSI